MPLVLMKIFEEAPRRFDRWMHLLTLGRLHKLRAQVVSGAIVPGSRVLEIGCGTGVMAAMLAERGATVVGIDAAQGMVAQAEGYLAQAGLRMQAEVRRLHALQVEDTFQEKEFDSVISILALSEMTDDEIDCLLPQCRWLLREGGQLIIADEVQPEGTLPRWSFRAIRFPARLLTYLILQASELKQNNLLLKLLYFLIEFPLMLLTFLVVPPATHPIEGLEGRIQRAGFRITGKKNFLGGSLKLIQAERVE